MLPGAGLGPLAADPPPREAQKKSLYYFIDGGSVPAGLDPPYNGCAVHGPCAVLATPIQAAQNER